MTEALRSIFITKISSLLWLHTTSRWLDSGPRSFWLTPAFLQSRMLLDWLSRLSLSNRISQVPFWSLHQIHVAWITAGTQPVNRWPLCSSHFLRIKCFYLLLKWFRYFIGRFTFVHLFDAYLLSLRKLFSARSPLWPYSFSSPERFDSSACTALSMGQ